MPEIIVPFSHTIIEVDMAERLRCINLAPGEQDTYTLNYLHVLNTDRITASTWELDPVDDVPLEIVSSSFPDNNVLTLVTLAVDEDYEGSISIKLTNRITTQTGRILARCVEVNIAECGDCGGC